ncbi:HAD hydrolase, subfamily IA and HAD-like domain-containing protein [Strongyloides ratti]|uniref:HAD hydrolase, subfamily IA and HAD-like domain-containing protein n=1 Tax=Strongyloides ratti TaxID=34506 RepID=A0A090LAQ1_STRRB|nr:HAD hydrolase, subfamily IA and HAD-like domain-containing protein [Strongyloides ratti]CEF66871.1 HAD hydrolase, subfamily IA and HAD-like domain-containing protein [Strongyloides ratti]
MLKSIDKSLVKVISFDVTDTIIRLKSTPGLIYSIVGRDFGLSLNANKIDSTFREHMKILQNDLPCYGHGKCSPKNWWGDLIHKCCDLQKNENSMAFVDRLFDELSTSKHYKLINNQTPKILQYLKSNGYKLAVVSNSDSRLRNILYQLLDENYFDEYLISSEIGISKPNKLVFLTLCQRLSCSPQDILHIGDNLTKDYQSIINVGGQGLLLNDSGDQISINSLDNLYFINKKE